MSKSFDLNLYSSTVNACYERGVPDDLTYKAAQIVATDNAEAPNLGRTDEDQEIMREVLPYLQSRENRE